MATTAIQDQQAAEMRVFTPQSAVDAGGEGGTRSGGEQGYWRKPNGDITFGATDVNGMRTYPRKRMAHLFEYGEFNNEVNRVTRWNPMNDPYRQILAMGGIKEFSLAQIVELGWHRKPHAILKAGIDRLVASGVSEQSALETVIPQLKGFERVDVPCLLCHGRVFNSDDELSRHEVLHKDDVQTRRLSDSIGSALKGGQAASTEAMTPILQMLAEAIKTLSSSHAETQDNLANTNALIARMIASQGDAPKSK